ncbi:hypothetical protein BH20ACT2_BH20ACT2_25010 [soil metagenome]
MLKRLLALGAALVLAAMGSAAMGTAQAQTYPPADNSLTASDTTLAPGDPITLTASIFQAGSTVTFTLFSTPATLGTATADAGGVATLNGTIPADTTPGGHRIEGTGTGADGQPLKLSLSVTITGAGGSGSGAGSGAGSGSGSGLPRTGSADTVPMTQMALSALAAGGLLVLLANKRRTAKLDARQPATV